MKAAKLEDRPAQRRRVNPARQPYEHLGFKPRIAHAADGAVRAADRKIDRIERLPARMGD
jgi:hypothetical protein